MRLNSALKFNKSPLEIIKHGLFKRSITYIFSSFFSKVISFFTLPIFTKYLSQYDYGILATFSAISSLLTGVLGTGGNTLLARRYFGLEEKERNIFISNILEVILINSVIVGIICFLFKNIITNIIKFNTILILLVIFSSLSSMIITILTRLFQLKKEAIKFAVFTNSSALIGIILSLFAIIKLGLKWEGVIGATILNSFIFLIISIFLFKLEKIKLHFSIKYLKELYFLGTPLIVGHISGWTNNMIDKLMINNLINIEATGLYSMGYKFGMVIMMIESAFSRAWAPFFYERIERNTETDKLNIVKVTYYIIAGLSIFSLLYGIFAKYFLYFLVDEKFYEAGKYIFLISMAYCFDGIRKLFSGYIIYIGKTNVYTLIIIISAIVNIFLNYILLKRIGLIGAAWATFVSFLVAMILTIIIAVKTYPMPWFILFKRGIK